MCGKGVGVGYAGSVGVKEEAGVCHITAAVGLGDGRGFGTQEYEEGSHLGGKRGG